MRRALVLTTESARHPFRSALPPHVWAECEAEEVERKVPWRLRLGLTQDDLRGFFAAYSACLVAAITFIV